MNNIKITVELSPEDRNTLEGLMGAVSLLASVLGNMQPAEVQQKIIQEAHQQTNLAPVEEDPAQIPDVEEPAAPEVKPVSLAEFQKAVTIVCAKGPNQKEAAKAIVNKYAASVSAVPEDKRAEAMAELAKI